LHRRPLLLKNSHPKPLVVAFDLDNTSIHRILDISDQEECFGSTWLSKQELQEIETSNAHTHTRWHENWNPGPPHLYYRGLEEEHSTNIIRGT
jgi:hypothetical protein